MQDLVGVRVADPGDHALVPQHPLDLPPLPPQQPREQLRREVRPQRVGPEPRDPRHLLRVPHDIDRQVLLRPGLRDVEPRPAHQPHPQRQRPLPRPRRHLRHLLLPPHPPAPGQMHHQPHIPTPKPQELPEPPHLPNSPPLQHPHGRLIRLERMHPHGIHPLHHPPTHPLPQKPHQRLNLRQFRHPPSLPLPPADRDPGTLRPTPLPAAPRPVPWRPR
ncbi:hypothetical protein SBRY_20760 [Actinacidiphila bryophytorum]|uniref:Uncharacterized protein n=1 Tax=Actinacidiphila bryophytorum TaxID=1436133 RepID=A0A9W4GZM2_9ACTN|nr:hypothetical protein SBRY_20760 [Actinacidiphila bryophytorum]